MGRLSLPLQARRVSWANKGKEGRKFQTAVNRGVFFYLSERPAEVYAQRGQHVVDCQRVSRGGTRKAHAGTGEEAHVFRGVDRYAFLDGSMKCMRGSFFGGKRQKRSC